MPSKSPTPLQAPKPRKVLDWPFTLLLVVLTGSYVMMIGGLLVADVLYMTKEVKPSGKSVRQQLGEEGDSPNPLIQALKDEKIRHSIWLSLTSCTITAVLSLWVAVPAGYLLSRYDFLGRSLLDAVLDIPIVLPPLVVGLSLLIFFQFDWVDAPWRMLGWEDSELRKSSFFVWLRVNIVYEIPAVILAQFMVACAFAVRTMRATFDQIDSRREQVALTLGCSRMQAFSSVVLPEAWRGMITAGTLAWARALGEFGPLLIFAGTVRGKTEVLSTTVFLEQSNGNLQGAVAVSLIMVFCAMVVLLLTRPFGARSLGV
jgi:molybdate transport system permease protein